MSKRVQAILSKRGDDIVGLHLQGESATRIAARIGVTTPTVTKWLVAQGWKKASKRGRYSEAFKSQMVRLFRSGWDPAMIQRRFGAPPEQLRAWDAAAQPTKVSRKKGLRKNPPKTQREKIAELIESAKHRKCRRWTPLQERMVLSAMADGTSTVRTIYDKTGASRRRQLKIWHKYRTGKAPPPIRPGVARRDEIRRRRRLRRDDRLNALVEELNECKRQIRLLELLLKKKAPATALEGAAITQPELEGPIIIPELEEAPQQRVLPARPRRRKKSPKRVASKPTQAQLPPAKEDVLDTPGGEVEGEDESGVDEFDFDKI